MPRNQSPNSFLIGIDPSLLRSPFFFPDATHSTFKEAEIATKEEGELPSFKPLAWRYFNLDFVRCQWTWLAAGKDNRFLAGTHSGESRSSRVNKWSPPESVSPILDTDAMRAAIAVECRPKVDCFGRRRFPFRNRTD